MGLCNRPRLEKAEEYKALHAAAWPGVLETITACNVRNFSIFLRTPGNLLFRVLGTSWRWTCAR
jgi:L-rhamnose mutarotase